MTQTFATAGPAGPEQVTPVAGALRHEFAAEHLIKMLAHADAEVRILAAWALRRLAVPATAASLLLRVRIDTDKPRMLQHRSLLPGTNTPGEYGHLEHLIAALGVLRREPARSLLSRYLALPPLPRPPGDKPLWRPELRAAAIWSLGHMAGVAPSRALVGTLRKRLSGEVAGALKRGDDAAVRAMAAISFGRMAAREAISELRQVYQDEKELPHLRRACMWALERLTQEKLADLKLSLPPREVWHRGWFLEPLDNPP